MAYRMARLGLVSERRERTGERLPDPAATVHSEPLARHNAPGPKHTRRRRDLTMLAAGGRDCGSALRAHLIRAPAAEASV